MDDRETDDIDVDELLGWAEFGSWSALVMTPIIWWLQGPSVSTDQFVVRTSLLVISAATGVVLRTRTWIRRKRTVHSDQQGPHPSNPAVEPGEPKG